MGKEARVRSAALILSKIKEINKANMPAILMGDFNLEPSSEGMVLFNSELQGAHLAFDAVHHGPEGTFNAFDIKNPSNRRIDYVFHKNSQLKVLREAVFTDSFDGIFPSDHFPVYVEFDIK
jgi:endonuclease/exonuclease/phosphatase family metal-dependent hydrolase